MYNNVVVTFETTDKKFLRLVTELLNSLKSTPQKSSLILEDLQNLSLDYINILPEHFFELLNMVNDLINNYAYYEHMNTLLDKAIDRILLLCSLLQEAPSVELFKKYIANSFETILEYKDFDEEILFSIIDFLKNLPLTLKINNYKEHRLYWLAISNMDLSKKVLLYAVKHFYLKGNDFIDFCQDIGVATNSDEEVLLALIERIENQRISSDVKRNLALKTRLYMTIIFTALPTLRVVKKIVEIIFLEDIEYCNFFCMIIDKFGSNNDVIETILKRLDIDELKSTENTKVYIRRLRLLAMNI